MIEMCQKYVMKKVSRKNDDEEKDEINNTYPMRTR
jgi:hypothetical protein